MRSVFRWLFIGSIWVFAPVTLRASGALDTMEQIIGLRAELKKAILTDNRKSGAQLTESLLALSNYNHHALMWDERWLVYHWSGQHRRLLEEIKGYSETSRYLEEYAKLPPADSLFELIDLTMFRLRSAYAGELQDLGLNPEEQSFLQIHLGYLLRDRSEEEKERRADFIKNYPQSAYVAFVKTFMALPPAPVYHYYSFDASLAGSNWTDNLTPTLRQGWGGYLGLNVHYKRWTFGGKFQFSRQRLNRSIFEGFDEWPKGAPSSFNGFGLGVGYHLLDASKIRIWPSGELGWATLTPVNADDTDIPEEEFFAIFNYTSFMTGVGLNFDLKMQTKEAHPKGRYPEKYHGVRVRVGYNWLYFDRSNPLLNGNLIYFTLGYQVSSN